MEIEITKRIYDKMVSHKFVVSIIGFFDQELLLSLINITDKKLSGLDVQQSLKKRIFHFMVECSQNLLKIERNTEHLHNNIFLIAQEDESYSVYLGSVVRKELLQPVLSVVEEVNTFDSAEIKRKYYEELTSSDVAQENMLLLSMLSISKRTREKINYDLIPVDDANCFLAFKITLTN